MKERLQEVIRESKCVMYQTHTYQGEKLNEGLRGIERRSFIDLNDIKGKKIIDLGCATGAECFWAIEQGARNALGFDAGEEQIEVFNKISQILVLDDSVHGIVRNLKTPLGVIGDGEWDTAFCFSITHHLGYRKIWHELSKVKVVYVEGGADSGYSEKSLTDELFDAKLIGHIPNDNRNPEKVRPLFKLTRKS